MFLVRKESISGRSSETLWELRPPLVTTPYFTTHLYYYFITILYPGIVPRSQPWMPDGRSKERRLEAQGRCANGSLAQSQSESAGEDSESDGSIRFSPSDFSSNHLFKIDFKYLERCIAFLVKSEQEHKARIAELELRRDSEHAMLVALDIRQQQQSPQVEALILALPPLIAQVQALIEAEQQHEKTSKSRHENMSEMSTTLSINLESLADDLKVLSSTTKEEMEAIKSLAASNSTQEQRRDTATADFTCALQNSLIEHTQQQDTKIQALDQQMQAHHNQTSKITQQITLLTHEVEHLRASATTAPRRISTPPLAPTPPVQVPMPPQLPHHFSAPPPLPEWRALSASDMSEELRRALLNTRQAVAALRPPEDAWASYLECANRALVSAWQTAEMRITEMQGARLYLKP